MALAWRLMQAASARQGPCWRWIVGLVNLLCTLGLTGGVAIGLGDGNEFDDVGCSSAQKPVPACERANFAKTGGFGVSRTPAAGIGPAEADGGQAHRGPKRPEEVPDCAYREPDGTCKIWRLRCQLLPAAGPGGMASAVVLGEVGTRYMLRKGLGAWEVEFEGQRGVIVDGRGIQLAAYLLFNPPMEPIHASQLARLALGQELVQEANLGDDGESTRRQLRAAAAECSAVLRDPAASDLERDEARSQLEDLAKGLEATQGEREGNAELQVRAVRKTLWRLIDDLLAARDHKNEPHRGLRAFGEHLHRYLRVPSSRYGGDRRSRVRAGVAGTFTYEPPEGVRWEG
jgi:hypothetical protein